MVLDQKMGTLKIEVNTKNRLTSVIPQVLTLTQSHLVIPCPKKKSVSTLMRILRFYIFGDDSG